MKTTKQYTTQPATATVKTDQPGTRNAPSATSPDRDFARQAYSGNFFAGPHSIFNPLLFKRREKMEIAEQ